MEHAQQLSLAQGQMSQASTVKDRALQTMFQCGERAAALGVKCEELLGEGVPATLDQCRF